MIQGPEQIGVPGRLPIGAFDGRSLLIDLPVARELGLLRGQIVEALVSIRSGQLYLELGGRSMALQGVPPFPVGTKLQFRVVYGQQGVTLIPVGQGVKQPQQAALIGSEGGQNAARIDSAAPPPRLPPPGLARLLAQAPISPTVGVQAGAAFQDAWAAAATQGRLPPELQGSPAPGLSQPLSPTAIRQSLMQSGLFLESQLVRQVPIPSMDLKLLLTQLLRLMPAASALARAGRTLHEGIERAQADALQAQQNRELAFSWLLFLSDESPVHLSLRRTRDDDVEAGLLWFIDAHLQTQGLGPVWMSAKVASEGKLDFVMWAAEESTATRARIAEADLRFELGQSGLDLMDFRVYGFARADDPETPQDPGRFFELDA